MLRKLILASLGLLVWCVPTSYADLTTDEKAQVRKVYEAYVSVDTSLDYLGAMLAETSSANQSLLNTQLIRASTLYNHFNTGIIQVLGVKAPNNNPVACSSFTTCSTTAWTFLGKSNLTGVSGGTCPSGPNGRLTIYKGGFTTLASDTGCSGAPCGTGPIGTANTFQWYADQSATLIQTAIDKICTITGEPTDASPLAWATPFPAYLTTSAARPGTFGRTHSPSATTVVDEVSSTQTIGPHGDFVSALVGLWNASTSVENAIGVQGATIGIRFAWQTPFSDGEPALSTAENTALGDMLQSVASAAQKFRHAIMGFALIPVSDTECGMSPTHLAASVLEGLLSKDVGIPFIFDAMQTSVFNTLWTTSMDASRPVFRTKFLGSQNNITSATSAWFVTGVQTWQFSDGASWGGAMEFPVTPTKTLAVLRAQFSVPQTSAPLCTDVTNPSATVTVPLTGATMSQLVTLTATASDNIGVSYLQFKVDGAVVGQTAYVAPYTIRWDSKEVGNGAHTITAVAYDGNGNSGTSSSVSVTVSN